MKEVTHIPHQHVEYIQPLEGQILIITRDPKDGSPSQYLTNNMTLDEKGLNGKFINKPMFG